MLHNHPLIIHTLKHALADLQSHENIISANSLHSLSRNIKVQLLTDWTRT